MVNNIELKKAVDFLKKKKCISIEYNDNVQFLMDAKEEVVTESQLNLTTENFTLLISSDRMANQCIKDIPEVAWDMMDYATTPLTLILDGGQFVSKRWINEDGSLAIQKNTKGILHDLVAMYNKPIACFQFSKEDQIPSDFKIMVKQSMIQEKIIRIRLNGEIEILAN
jgi:tRNA A37 threonylcarbamoyladenosine synthetase subunit TsaC/SUA5/YrdC